MLLVLLTHLVIAKRLRCGTDLGQKPRIFPAAALNIAGKHTQQHHKPQKGIQKAQHRPHHGDQTQGQRDQIQRQNQHTQRSIELVVAIASIHKAHQRISHSVQKSHSIFLFLFILRSCAAGVVDLYKRYDSELFPGSKQRICKLFASGPLFAEGSSL